MTNVEFRQSLSKKQVGFLREKYKDLLNQVEEELDGCSYLSFGDKVESVGKLLLLASTYKELLLGDSLDGLFSECYERYENI
ncbi:hypothetical protein [Veillonella sp. 3310]|uniref:hypothetical protein n=1 Tax=Veillonella sp. 3310 TaxID=2490956 RepID=UPI000FD6367A|nr:hypothetical protein [Veillonella sp. 3310]